MAYSITGIVNLALGKIGQPKIEGLYPAEDSVAAIQADAVWEYVRDEVLEAADWTFAKTRVALALNTTTPVQGFSYAYTLPADFLRMGRARKADPNVYPMGAVAVSSLTGFIEVQGTKYNYVIETLLDGTECLFTDYSNSTDDLFIQYIRRVTNPARYTGSFISALAFRLGAELAPVLTESNKKFENMMTLYTSALKAAKGLNQSSDYLADETGNTDWADAGR